MYFYILEGNNGASYILNTKDAEAIDQSLSFYKARTSKQKDMKFALKMYLHILKLSSIFFTPRGLKKKGQVEQYLQKVTNSSINFNIDNDCSILVSPTRDKVIVHHHKKFFHKFAFGNSYQKVKNEASIYALLSKKFRYFHTSMFYDFVDTDENYCNFKLQINDIMRNNTINIDMVSALVEFFDVTRTDAGKFSSYINDLKYRYDNSKISNKTIESVLKKLESSYKDEMIPLGLVHRDFKPWNIDDKKGLLIYDFEETKVEGLPLEDLLNFFIDPVIMHDSLDNIYKIIVSEDCTIKYKEYLEKLNITTHYILFIYCYIIEKILFYTEPKYHDIRDKYIELLEHFIQRKGIYQL